MFATLLFFPSNFEIDLLRKIWWWHDGSWWMMVHYSMHFILLNTWVLHHSLIPGYSEGIQNAYWILNIEYCTVRVLYHVRVLILDGESNEWINQSRKNIHVLFHSFNFLWIRISKLRNSQGLGWSFWFAIQLCCSPWPPCQPLHLATTNSLKFYCCYGMG